jgi:serine/threonine protein kinase
MSNKQPEVVGEGTYGCVHSPSLKCKDAPSISYLNKVSKLLKNKDAKKELAEYDKVIEADKNKDYYLGKPEDCNLDNRNVINLKSIQKCKIGSDVLKNLSGFKLLIMKDGGINLEKYTKKMKEWSVSEMNTELCEKFVLESMRLFKGLKVFEEHGLVHHDLKPQNVVYDEVTNRMNFIDFGLMASRKKIINEARKSTYDFALFHWSFPWEYEFINQKEFNNVIIYPENQQEILEEIHDEIRDKNGKYYEHIKTFFYYNMDRYAPITKYQEDCREYVDGYGRTITDNMLEMKYEKFLDASVRTIDIFGLGITLNYWFHAAKKFLSPLLVSELGVLYNKMVSPELKFRPLINELIINMEEILNKSGLLQKYNKKLLNHMVVDSIEIEKQAISIEENVFEKINKPNPGLVATDPGDCPEGMVKNIKDKCVKLKQSEGVCPEDKERNPKTKRCVAKCKPGYVRNEDFKCIKIKQPRQVIDKAALPCPEGKERNPKTRRCVAKCKPGYVRNADFKCVKNKTQKIGN